ncbi:uncharacterized protein LOC119388109 [Rhipicephalus sanguineus]|uniref:uncharacterized protein LOC119388109 n=1 Tax=Rhipicephalus sanguineus TaxID=34632 RepID=UPI001894612E|nr:uncharacterized protein LOC119388109 [Rhipicephalus sanguineus]
MRAPLLTCAAIIACCCWPAGAQDDTTDAPEVATDQPPPVTTPPPPPPPPGINPNHSYYPPSYKPHFGGYNPNGYWNSYPSQGYYPHSWSYRPPAYHPPPTTYEWWRQFNRRPSFEHGGLNGGGGGYGYWPSAGSGYMQPYYGSSWWQPYYVAVGYYRRSSSPPQTGTSYPSYGGHYGGYGYGAGYPYVSGYDKFGYPYYRSGYYGGGLYGGHNGYGGGNTRSYGCYTSGCGSYAPSYPYQGGYPYNGGYPYTGGSYGSYPYKGGSYGSYPYYNSYATYPYHSSGYGGQPYYGGGHYNYGYGHGTYYPSGGGQTGYPSYPTGYYSPHSYGYGYGYGYPHYNQGSSYSNGYGGYSTGKYSGGGSYPYDYYGAYYNRYYPDYHRHYYYPGMTRGWYDCTYYPTAVNKGYAVSGSEGVKQKVDRTKQNTEKIKRTFTRRSIRELLKSAEYTGSETRRANDRGPMLDLSNDGLVGGIALLSQDAATKKDTTTSMFKATDNARSFAKAGEPNEGDQRITPEMVESFERRLTAMNRMFEELLTPKDMQDDGDYFMRRVRAYRRLLGQVQQRGMGIGTSPNDLDSQGMLRRLRMLENELDDRRRRALRTLYHALIDADLTVSDKLKVLATVYNFAKGDMSDESDEGAESMDRSVISSEAEAVKTPENGNSMTDADAKKFYDKLEKFLELTRTAEPSTSDEGGERKFETTSGASKSLSNSLESSSSESSSSESDSSGDRTKFEIKGSVSLALDVEGKTDFGTDTIGNLMKTMLS